MTNPYEPPRAALLEPELESPRGRPLPVTIVCIVGFLGAAITLAFLFTPLPARVGSWYPPLLAGSAAIGLACMVGLWRMKRRAVQAYTIFTLCVQYVLIASGIWTPPSLVVPAIVMAIGWRYVARMS